jgi:small subunit ribosomal protein S16
MIVIRLIRRGKKNQPFFRIVVTDKRNSPKGGRFLEILGFFNPLTKEKGFKKERIKYWLSVGAQTSDRVHNLLIDEKVIEGKKIAVHKKAKKKKKTGKEPKEEKKVETKEEPKKETEEKKEIKEEVKKEVKEPEKKEEKPLKESEGEKKEEKAEEKPKEKKEKVKEEPKKEEAKEEKEENIK